MAMPSAGKGGGLGLLDFPFLGSAQDHTLLGLRPLFFFTTLPLLLLLPLPLPRPRPRTAVVLLLLLLPRPHTPTTATMWL